ncbi:MAG: AEC family transporter [Candidatus Heimdallarchaeota archaeon]|nr:MAG: AEC family transporter [Candidatus Heimdallarchaeota archaeon]
MSNVFPIIFSIVILFILGILLKSTTLLKRDDADVLLKIVFYISLPALILNTIPTVDINLTFFFLPILSSIIIIITFLVSSLVVNYQNFEEKTKGVFIIGTMIMNLGFNVPFVLGAYGVEGFARATFFDIGNITLTLSLTYFIAQKHGSLEGEEKIKFLNKKLITSPPLIALIIGLILNFTGVSLDFNITYLLDLLSGLLTPLLILSIGIYFNPTLENIFPVTQVILIRMGLGLTLGVVFALLLGLDDLSSKIIIISSAAPVGFNTLTYAALEDLDKEFAANILSIGIPLGIVTISLLLIILG